MISKILHIMCVLLLASLSVALFVCQAMSGRLTPLGTILGVGMMAMAAMFLVETRTDIENRKL